MSDDKKTNEELLNELKALRSEMKDMKEKVEDIKETSDASPWGGVNSWLLTLLIIVLFFVFNWAWQFAKEHHWLWF